VSVHLNATVVLYLRLSNTGRVCLICKVVLQWLPCFREVRCIDVASELLTELNAGAWEAFADHTAIIAAVRTKALPLIVREIGYTPNKEIDLMTVLGTVRLDFDLDQLLDMLKIHRARFEAVHKPEAWTPGKKFPIEPHWLTWAEKAGRIDPKRLDPLEAEAADFEEVGDDD